MSDRQRTHNRKAKRAQMKAQINRDEARRKLLRQRKKLAKRRRVNREQSKQRRDDGKSQNNPTAHSTLPPQKSNAQNAVRNSHSTVPETPKYSTVQARKRLYGQRLYRATSGDASTTPGPDTEASPSSDTREKESDATTVSSDE